jgi:hypothetical protein
MNFSLHFSKLIILGFHLNNLNQDGFPHVLLQLIKFLLIMLIFYGSSKENHEHDLMNICHAHFALWEQFIFMGIFLILLIF